MDIEEFYDADERRRDSEELELGNDWRDAQKHRFVLSYVVDTGELYLMAAPDVEAIEDPFGDIAVDSEPTDELLVEILVVVADVDALHAALAGWEEEIGKPSSLEWLRKQVSTLGTP
ncbi:MAG TPA: hypothetical protein VIE15_04685 [Acidimicrobiales bacterium]